MLTRADIGDLGGQYESQRDVYERLASTVSRLIGDALQTVERLMIRTAERIQANEEQFVGPEDLRRYLENRLRQSCAGDFGSLLRLLNSLFVKITPKRMDELVGGGASISEVRELSERFDQDGAHQEVGQLVLRILPGLGYDKVASVLEGEQKDWPPLWKFIFRVVKSGGRS